MKLSGTLLGLAASALVLGVLGFSYISAFNAGNSLENSIEAAWKQSENVLAQYGQKIAEAAQVPAMQRDDLSKVVTDALQSRYGADGSKAVFQWIQEQNPKIDSKVYVQLQQMIESGRNDFSNSQKMMIDRKQIYNTQLGSFWRGFWLDVAGYPKRDMSKYIEVTTSRASDTFKTGVEASPIKLR